MIRVLIYLGIVGALAIGAVWLADRPGDVLITWQNRRIEMSVMALVVGVAAVALSTVLLWSLLRGLLKSPGLFRDRLRTRRGLRGYRAISQGLIAVGSGDVRAARKFAVEAARIAPQEPLTLLLGAQASQLAGAREAAELTFHAMASRDDTRLLGLHGLFIEAQRQGKAADAMHFAEAAAKAPNAPIWATLAVFDARCARGDWIGALERLDSNVKSGLIDRTAYGRLRAVLLTARALEAEGHDDRDGARSLALEAVKFAPTLVPAAALAGRLLGEAGDMRRAARVVEAAWKANPHPDLAEAYAHLQPGDSARDRLTRVERLSDATPGNIEGALAVARAGLDAQEFAIARRALAPLSIAPSRRVAMLMAELEEKEHGDEGRAREWMTRAMRARHDPAWTADGIVSDRWMPVSPATGRIDAFQWRDPIEELGSNEPVIEHEKEPRAGIAAPPPPEQREPEIGPSAPRPADAMGPVDVQKPADVTKPADIEKPVDIEKPADLTKPVEAMPPATLPATSGERGLVRTAEAAAPIAPVVPLVHVPDDPGPDAPPHPEPVPETSSEPPSDGWRKLRGLFK